MKWVSALAVAVDVNVSPSNDSCRWLSRPTPPAQSPYLHSASSSLILSFLSHTGAQWRVSRTLHCIASALSLSFCLFCIRFKLDLPSPPTPTRTPNSHSLSLSFNYRPLNAGLRLPSASPTSSMMFLLLSSSLSSLLGCCCDCNCDCDCTWRFDTIWTFFFMFCVHRK